MVGIVLAFLSQSCGYNIYYYYSYNLVGISGLDVSPKIVGIAIVLLDTAGAILATQLVEPLGRKCLLIVSLVGCIIGLSGTATYSYCSSLDFEMSMFSWVPVTSLGLFAFMAALGIRPLPMICLVELLPEKVRSFGLTVGSISMNIFTYFSVSSFLAMADVIGMSLHSSLLLFAITCVFGIFFVFFFVEETKGKALDLPIDENFRNIQENA